MKPSLIKTILRRKISKWANTIEDEELSERVKKETVVMGGAICSMLQNEKPNDIDVYFRNPELAIKIASYYYKQATGDIIHAVESKEHGQQKGYCNFAYVLDDPKGVGLYIKSSGRVDGEAAEIGAHHTEELPDELAEELFGTTDENDQATAKLRDPDDKESEPSPTKRFRVKCITDNAVTLSDGLQIVLRFCGEPKEILEYYDFEHCKMWFQTWDNKLVTPEAALEALLNKRLVYTGSKYPICSLFRVRKFLQRGFRVNAGMLVRISYQISHLNLDDVEVLQSQLIGCDHMYFIMLIEKLRTVGKDDPDAVRNHLDSLIDEFFG